MVYGSGKMGKVIMGKAWDLLFSVPKTIWFNFRYLPMKQAKRLPIWIHYGTSVEIHEGGKIILPLNVSLAMIRIGFHRVEVCGSDAKTVLSVSGGILCFQGTAHIGHGSKIHVSAGGRLTLGDNFAISASSALNCYKSIRFGKDVQFSWDCLVMDSDTHKIYDDEGNVTNEAKEIVVGDKVWIGCRATILKGAVIPNNCVIGSCSLVSGNKYEPNSVIVGVPAKSIKKIGGWKL